MEGEKLRPRFACEANEEYGVKPGFATSPEGVRPQAE